MAKKDAKGPRTLTIDIGGTGLKMLVLDPRGRPLSERSRVATPQPATPTAMLRALGGLIAQRRASTGVGRLPGVVDDVVEPHRILDPSWQGPTSARRWGA
jgi:polyphosphate glucokinase